MVSSMWLTKVTWRVALGRTDAPAGPADDGAPTATRRQHRQRDREHNQHRPDDASCRCGHRGFTYNGSWDSVRTCELIYAPRASSGELSASTGHGLSLAIPAVRRSWALGLVPSLGGKRAVQSP